MATELYKDRSEVATAADHRTRWEQRWARREENTRIAQEAARARRERNGGTKTDVRIANIKKRLEGANIPTTVQLIEAASGADRDLYLLVEEYGPNRKGVLRQFGPPRASARETFMRVEGLGSPDETDEVEQSADSSAEE